MCMYLPVLSKKKSNNLLLMQCYKSLKCGAVQIKEKRAQASPDTIPESMPLICFVLPRSIQFI